MILGNTCKWLGYMFQVVRMCVCVYSYIFSFCLGQSIHKFYDFSKYYVFMISSCKLKMKYDKTLSKSCLHNYLNDIHIIIVYYFTFPDFYIFLFCELY